MRNKENEKTKTSILRQPIDQASPSNLRVNNNAHHILPVTVHSRTHVDTPHPNGHSQAMKKMQKAMDILRMTKPCSVRDFVEQVPSVPF